MRIQRILVGAALLMLCAAAAYAQITVSSTPVTTVISTGRSEVAGALRLTASAAGVVADTITIRYGGLPITNAVDLVPANVYVDTAGGWVPTAIIVDRLNGIITLSCPLSAGGTFFTVQNVRLNMEGYAGANVSATVGTLANTVIAGQNSAVVINSIAPGLTAASTITTPIVALANSNIVTPGGVSSAWRLTEGFASAWKNVAQAGADATAAQGTQILLTCAGLPAGANLALGATIPATLGIALSQPAFTSTVTQSAITFSATSQAAVETIDLVFTLTWTTAPAIPLTVASYTVNATLSPVQIALNADGTLPTSVKYPRFASATLPAGGLTVLTITPNSTSFIIPYLTTDLGYDTGIAISNTTTDPFAVGSATKQDGPVTVYFYGNDGTTVTYSSATDAAKGKGMTAGVLKTGSTWTVLASELLTAKGRTTPLSGYAIVVLNATNGHGQAYVSNFSGFTSGSPMLVLSNPATVTRAGVSTEVTSH